MWNPKLWAVSAILILTSLAGTAWYSYSSGRQSGMSQIQTRWDAERLAQQEAVIQAQQKARETEQALQAQVDKIKRESASEKRRIAAQYERTIAGLRNRPEARAGATGVPEGANPGVGCTGAGLSKPDGEFLGWLAEQAARTQAALKACQLAYEQVRLANTP
jgi:hypothetical protein